MKDISIAIITSDNFLRIKTRLLLIQEEFTKIDTFESIEELKEKYTQTDYDLIITDEETFESKKFSFVDKNTFFLILTENMEKIPKLTARRFYFSKHFSSQEFIHEINTISLLKFYEKEMEEKNKKLEEALKYIQTQEEMGAEKQLNMIFDNISFKKIKNYIFDNYYSPKDKLSGDSYIAWHKDGKIFIVIADAMGKGLSASLTSTLTTGIGNYILNNNMNLQKILNNYINYIKKILLEDEILCMLIFKLDLNTNEFQIANFGMPPVYLKKGSGVEKILPNNLPIFKESKEKITIDKYNKNFDMILLTSDGLIESLTKKGIPYYANLKKILPKSNFLREILKDFKKNAVQDDDTTVYAIINQKNQTQYKKIFEYKFTFSSKEDLDKIILKLDNKLKVDELTKQKLYLIFQETFLNIFEHAYRENYNKHEIIENNKDFSKINGQIDIKINKNDQYLNIIIKDNGKGFDVSKILKHENKINFKKYHRRGLLILLNIVDGIFFDDNGRCVHIYLRSNHGN